MLTMDNTKINGEKNKMIAKDENAFPPGRG